jgi:flagellar biosynthetic protein FlhB
MSEDSDQEKTEEPTQRKLDKAREDGQVPRSRELTTFMMLLCGIVALWSVGGGMRESLSNVMETAFSFDRAQAFDVMPMIKTGQEMAKEGMLSLVPLFLIMLIVALVSPNLLSGPMISAKSLKPQLSKLNPIKGIKKLFSEQALVELGKVIAKSVLIGIVLALFLMSRLDEFRGLMHQPLEQAIANALSQVFQVAMLLVLTLIVAAGIDVPFQLFQHTKKLRMTKHDIKQEHKESDGDPLLKSRIRAQQQEMARGRMMQEVPKADVVINNPTHFSVALKYGDDMGAPRVIAKGRNDVAAKIREIAQENNVPMIEAPPLARALYHNVDIGREIPMELFNAVAEVLAWAFSLKKNIVTPTPTNISVPEGMDKGSEPEDDK